VKVSIDECLHTSLVELAHAAGHAADHVNYLGLGGLKDWQFMGTIRQQDYTFVTNNRSDFLALHGAKKARHNPTRNPRHPDETRRRGGLPAVLCQLHRIE
jgi:hypothetical protein